jgi:nitrogen-specific signal transduction histidine kinase
MVGSESPRVAPSNMATRYVLSLSMQALFGKHIDQLFPCLSAFNCEVVDQDVSKAAQYCL